ncbi:PqqD family protein [Streptacidiphilus sp. 4-A2]|nr:PqqD family protein [Streptacidiphilus sp. 4-A2]
MTSLRPHVTATPSGRGMILLDTRSGKYWQLNDTGALVLRNLLRGATPAETAVHWHKSIPLPPRVPPATSTPSCGNSPPHN